MKSMHLPPLPIYRVSMLVGWWCVFFGFAGFLVLSLQGQREQEKREQQGVGIWKSFEEEVTDLEDPGDMNSPQTELWGKPGSCSASYMAKQQRTRDWAQNMCISGIVLRTAGLFENL